MIKDKIIKLKETPQQIYKNEADNTYTVVVQYPRTKRRPSVERKACRAHTELAPVIDSFIF